MRIFLLSIRNGFPPIRILRRWVGLDPVEIVEKLDKTESQNEKVQKDHEENIKRLRSKLEELKKGHSLRLGLNLKMESLHEKVKKNREIDFNRLFAKLENNRSQYEEADNIVLDPTI